MRKFHKEHMKENIPPVLRSANETFRRSLLFTRHLSRTRSVSSISSSLAATEMQEVPLADEPDLEEERDLIEKGISFVIMLLFKKDMKALDRSDYLYILQVCLISAIIIYCK